jgi:hypothetical protein
LAAKERQCCADGATGFLVMPGLSESIVSERFPDDCVKITMDLVYALNGDTLSVLSKSWSVQIQEEAFEKE